MKLREFLEKNEFMKSDIVPGLIETVCRELMEMLMEKNKAYGDSALNPLRIFSHAEAGEQLNVRIDDKLSRIARGHAAGEDAEWDLMGYLVLKRVLGKLNDSTTERVDDGAGI